TPPAAETSFSLDQGLAIVQRLAPQLSLLWMLGWLFFALRWGGSQWYLHRLRHQYTRPSDFVWQQRADKLARRMGLKRMIPLLESHNVQSPMVIGHLKPVILVPMSLLSGISPSQLDAILAHELAHIQRHDFLINQFHALVEMLFFYHPAYWWISSRLRDEREHCCDDVAVAVCGDAIGYARILTEMEEKRIKQSPLAMGFLGHRKHLFHRIKRLVVPHQIESEEKNRSAFALLLLVSMGMMAMISPQKTDAQNRTQVSGPAVAVLVPAPEAGLPSIYIEEPVAPEAITFVAEPVVLPAKVLPAAASPLPVLASAIPAATPVMGVIEFNTDIRPVLAPIVVDSPPRRRYSREYYFRDGRRISPSEVRPPLPPTPPTPAAQPRPPLPPVPAMRANPPAPPQPPFRLNDANLSDEEREEIEEAYEEAMEDYEEAMEDWSEAYEEQMEAYQESMEEYEEAFEEAREEYAEGYEDQVEGLQDALEELAEEFSDRTAEGRSTGGLLDEMRTLERSLLDMQQAKGEMLRSLRNEELINAQDIKREVMRAQMEAQRAQQEVQREQARIQREVMRAQREVQREQVRIQMEAQREAQEQLRMAIEQERAVRDNDTENFRAFHNSLLRELERADYIDGDDREVRIEIGENYMKVYGRRVDQRMYRRMLELANRYDVRLEGEGSITVKD
ncbi:MAG: M56 family metallopeptidase, partial [Bacteroidota bacterium]